MTADTPPTFLFHTNADTGVVAENSVRFYLALRRAKVPAELHIFENGPHGVGLALGDPALVRLARAADELAPGEGAHQVKAQGSGLKAQGSGQSSSTWSKVLPEP